MTDKSANYEPSRANMLTTCKPDQGYQELQQSSKICGTFRHRPTNQFNMRSCLKIFLKS